MIIMIATTRHFEFIGLGHDEEEAANALLNRYAAHAAESSSVDPGYMRELVNNGSVQVVELEPGTAVRYGE